MMTKERILLLGPPGVGKTFAWLTIAAANPDAQFHVVDTDNAVERMMRKPLANVHPHVVFEWEELISTVDGFKLGEDDWLVVDMVGACWEMVQRHFSDQVFGQSVDAYFLEARKAQKVGSPFDGRQDWTVINKLYNRFAMSLLRIPGHLLLTAPVETIAKDEKDGGILSTYSAYGVKPRAQKHTGHLVHTILLLSKTRVGDYKVTTVKDRARKELEGLKLSNFYRDYLVPIGGWGAT